MLRAKVIYSPRFSSLLPLASVMQGNKAAEEIFGEHGIKLESQILMNTNLEEVWSGPEHPLNSLLSALVGAANEFNVDVKIERLDDGE